MQALPPEQTVVPVAEAMDLHTFFAQRGIPQARFNQCLTDQAAVQRLADITNRAMTSEGVPGTPTFFINGEMLSVSSWSDLEPLLRQRIGG